MADPKDIMAQINSKMALKYKSKAPELFTGNELPAVDWISTGMLGYDWVNGGGGPRGHIEQIYGARSSGKTTVVLRRIAECQRNGGVAAFIDVEHTLDRGWAKKQGVNLDTLIVYSPEEFDSAEVILTVVIEMLRSGDIDLIVVDSVPALCPQAKMDKGMEDRHYAGVAGILSQFFDKIIGPGIMYNSNAVLIFINQPRDTIGSFIPTERLPGGRALGHYSSIINQVKRGDYITIGAKNNEEKIGVEVKIINHKNKVRTPFKEQTLRLHFANGFNPLWEVVQFARFFDLVEMRGAWMYYGELTLGQGAEQHMTSLKENPSVYFELKKLIRERIISMN